MIRAAGEFIAIRTVIPITFAIRHLSARRIHHSLIPPFVDPALKSLIKQPIYLYTEAELFNSAVQIRMTTVMHAM